MQRLFSRQMPLVMLTILFLQFLSSFASVYAVATPNTSSIVAVTQKASKVDVSISMAALDDNETKDTLVISNAQLIDVPDSGDITATDSNKTIATYQKSSSADTLTITRLTDKVTTGNLEFSIKQSGTVRFKLNNDEEKTAAVTADDKDAATSATSSSSKDDATTATSTKSTKSLKSSVPTDISNYLPDESKGTIIDTADIVFTDSDGKTVDPSDVTSDTNIKLAYNWSIPNDLKDGYQLKDGDYFTFNLPEGIQYKAGTGSLGDYGTYQITSDGKVTFTFNDKVESDDTISGTFNYNSTISSETTTGTHIIDIPTKDGPHDTTIVVNPTGGNDISKSGQLDGQNHSKNATGITWDVDINTNMQELNNATVTDPMPKSTDGKVTTTLKSTTVYPLTVDLKGNVTGKGAALVEGKDYTVDSNGKVTFIGDYAKTNSAFRIEYTSDIDATTLPEDGGSVTFKNVATLNNGDKTATADASVTANYGKLLEKVYDGQDNNGSQKYNWHINYNFGEEKLSADKATLVDTLSDGQVFPADSKPVLTYEDGSVVPESAYQVSYNGSRTAMTIKFTNGLDQGVKIAYQSQVTAPIEDNPDNPKVTISNKVTSNDKEANGGTHVVGQQGLTKSRGAVDYNAKTVAWNFDINMARQDMSNWSMDDTVPDGLTVDYDSFVLKNKDTNITYNNKTDYRVVPTGKGFTIEFLGALKTSAPNWYTLSYKTSFDTNKLTNGKWTNTAEATWTDKNGTKHTNNGSADFTPITEAQKDGSKSGSYNAVNKHITWTVVGNYNQRELKNATIVDPIVDQAYVDGSAKLYEATINTNGSYTLGSEVTDANIALNSDKTKITASLPDGSTKAYVLKFETSLDGKVINQSPYKNTATYTNDGKPSDLTASVSVPDSGSLVTKNGVQDTSDSAYAKYNIWVNKSQSTLKNVVVDDTPSDNQIIDAQSIVVNETTFDKNGKIIENTSAPLVLNKDYKVDLTTDPSTGKQELKISFVNQISKAYVINYRSLINSSKSNDTLTNSVTITGDNEQQYTETKTTNTNVVNNGGSANGKNLNLVISKTDADTKKALPGATFELYSDVKGQKGQLLRSGTTGTDGKLAWNNLKSGKYVLVETSAPDGYNIASDYAAGKEITVTYADHAVDSNNNFTLDVTNEEKTGSVVLTKTDSDTKKVLAGATFSLYKSDGTKVASDLTTDDKGQISKDGLKPGDYYFVETAAPAGYDLNKDKQYKFTIAFQDKENVGKVVKVSATNAETTGSVVLNKTDSDTGNKLAGATFDLYAADGTKVAKNLKTDAKGEIKQDGLKPGKYYFVETKAPAGYDFDKDKHYDFTVELQTTTKVATVSAKNTQKTGSVVLTKKDTDTKKVLAGATFSLYKADGTEVAKDLVTDANGQISKDNLKPGDYYFVETAAPAGYDFDKDKHYDFTVVLQKSTKVAKIVAKNDEKTGSVVLTKTDSDTNKVLAGATFSLYKADGTKVAKNLKTDANGQISQTGLKPGKYYFVETKAPAGYDFDKDKHYDFTVELQTTTKVATVSATNAQKTGSVVLTKKDSDTGKVLAGATFSLYKADGTKVAKNLKTDDKGEIKQADLKPGDYYFVETAAPDGYNFDKDKHYDFTVELQTTAKVATVSATNEEKTGSVVLTKTDSDTGKVLPGATFSLYKSDGTEVATDLPTDDKGQITKDDLKPGDYYFVETAAPDGYNFDKDKHYDFTVELQTTTKVATVSATNAQKTGSVVLTKTDSDTNKVLAGATFDLYKADGTKVANDLTTNADGQIKQADLKPGGYYFLETAAPAGYNFDKDKHYDFTVDLQTTAKVATVSATNEEKTGSVVLTKTDSDTGKVLAGATFDLYKADGTKVVTESPLTTDDKGQITKDGLKPGDYYFLETAAPAGYNFDKDKHYDFTVDLQTTAKVATVSATNEEKTGSVVLTKTDSDTNKVLAGATFTLYKADGTKVAKNLKTDANGQISQTGLKPGKYYFVETKAPAGYDFDKDKHYDFTVELQTTTKVATVSATNAQKTGSVVLIKKDSDTGKVLPGATFSLYKADGTKVAKNLKTDAKGEINKDGLKPGAYYFVETAAPKGYNFDKNKQYKFTVELQTKSKVATVSVTNTKIPVTTPTNNKTSNKHHKHKRTHFLPDTAAKAVLFVSLLGSVLISVILVTSILNRKNKSND